MRPADRPAVPTIMARVAPATAPIMAAAWRWRLTQLRPARTRGRPADRLTGIPSVAEAGAMGAEEGSADAGESGARGAGESAPGRAAPEATAAMGTVAVGGSQEPESPSPGSEPGAGPVASGRLVSARATAIPAAAGPAAAPAPLGRARRRWRPTRRKAAPAARPSKTMIQADRELVAEGDPIADLSTRELPAPPPPGWRRLRRSARTDALCPELPKSVWAAERKAAPPGCGPLTRTRPGSRPMATALTGKAVPEDWQLPWRPARSRDATAEFSIRSSRDRLMPRMCATRLALLGWSLPIPAARTSTC
jgi:hypothetical protein